jgi:hypothetical protein
MGVIWVERMEEEIRKEAAKLPPLHKHRCKNCGEEFEATCAHLFYSHKPNGSVTHRPAVPAEFPYYVPACPKPECTWRGF